MIPSSTTIISATFLLLPLLAPCSTQLLNASSTSSGSSTVSTIRPSPTPKATKQQATAIGPLHFEPFKPTESYKCGQFIESSINDPAMRLLYKANNAFIRLMSKEFPHEKLLNSDALAGDLGAWHRTFNENRDDWIRFEQNWLVASLGLVAATALFTLLYLLYSCCVCCCRSNSERKNGVGSDKRWDRCKRGVLNTLISLFIVWNVFAAVVLLINVQYAQYGLEEMPTRLHYCTNDVSIYRSETDQRVRKLLTDDFHLLNTSLTHALDNAGAEMVGRIKRNTGAYQIDDVLAKVKKSRHLQQQFRQLQRDLPTAMDSRLAVQRRLLRLSELESSLESRCTSNAARQAQQQATSQGGSEQAVCREVALLVKTFLTNLEKNQATDAVAKERGAFLPVGVLTQLEHIDQLSVENTFDSYTDAMEMLRGAIQKLVHLHRGDAVERLRAVDDTLFRLYEDVSITIRSVDLKWLDEKLDEPLMRHREQLRTYSHYGWVAFLVIAGALALMALKFLLGLFYGCCGRRPDYASVDDDCCVKTTGGKLYACGTWFALSLMIVLSVIAAVMMFIGANASSMLCLPMQDPLSRPDAISLVERIAEQHGLKSHIPEALRQGGGQQLRLVSLIGQCQHNATLYTMLGLDRKFKLLDGGGPGDEYAELEKNIDMIVARVGEGHQLGAVSFSTDEMVDVLERLEQVHVPTLDDKHVRQLKAEGADLDLEPIITQLRTIAQTQQQQNGNSKQPSHELEAIIAFLESVRIDAQTAAGALNSVAKRMEAINGELEAMRFNTSELSGRLRNANSMFLPKHLTERLEEAAGQVAHDITNLVRAYASHVKRTVSEEIGSCAPLANIARSTKAVVCDYTLDPFNAAWMAMALSLLALLPIIVMSTALRRLYRSAYPYTRYTVNEQNANDAMFATDIYVDACGDGGGGTYGGYGGLADAGGYAVLNGGSRAAKLPTAAYSSHYAMTGMENSNGRAHVGYRDYRPLGTEPLRPPAYR